jgi:hypothetical protein
VFHTVTDLAINGVVNAGANNLVKSSGGALTLSGTQVTDAALGSLTKLPRLKKLAIAFTAVGDDALAAFAAARPDVAVER